MRDIGPTFLLDPDGGSARSTGCSTDGVSRSGPRGIATPRSLRPSSPGPAPRRFASPLVNEGGAIHVDGEGTVLLTESVLLDPDRNPGWSKADVVAELRATSASNTPSGSNAASTTDHELLRHARPHRHARRLRAPRPDRRPRPARPDPSRPRDLRPRTSIGCGGRPTLRAARSPSSPSTPPPYARRTGASSTTPTSTTTSATASCCSAASATHRTGPWPSCSRRLFPDRAVEMCDATVAVRPGRRDPLHHPAGTGVALAGAPERP